MFDDKRISRMIILAIAGAAAISGIVAVGKAMTQSSHSDNVETK
jgi:hypothetical protein